jgi:hypothetical protein
LLLDPQNIGDGMLHEFSLKNCCARDHALCNSKRDTSARNAA